MYDAMGGYNSIHYRQFLEYCGKVYNAIRRHTNLFYVLLRNSLDEYPRIFSYDITSEYIKSMLM